MASRMPPRPSLPWPALLAVVALPAMAAVAALPSEPVAGLGPVEGLVALQVLALLVTSAVHELGHWLAATAVGFRVAGWRVGPLAGMRTPLGWRLRLSPLSLAGGLLVPEPVRPEALRRRYTVVVLGGPAAHLALAGVLWATAAVTGRLPVSLTAATVLATGLANLVPVTLRPGDRWSDGRWLWAWAFRPALAAQRVAVGSLQLALAAGVRPRDWDRGWVLLAVGGPRRPADRAQVAGCLLGYRRALDQGDVDEAAGLLTRAFAGRGVLPQRVRAALAIEAAFFAARYRGDSGLASRLLESEGRRPWAVLEPDLQRARAALHLAEGREVEAVHACDRALVALDGRAAGLAALDRELVLAMREEAGRGLAGGEAGPAAPAAPAGWAGGAATA